MSKQDGLPIPNEILLILMRNLDAPDVRSLGNTCKRLRQLLLSNKSKLSCPQLSWKEAHLSFGRRIVLLRVDAKHEYKRRRIRGSDISAQWEFTEESFTEDFVDLFLMLSPETLILKCKDLDVNITSVIKRCVGKLSGKTLALEMDKCSLPDDDFASFLRYLSPFSLHLSGHFDRSLLSDQILPLSSLYSLYIGTNRADVEARTRISGITVRKIVNNWFQNYPSQLDSKNPAPCCVDYEKHDFLIVLPDCDLDYNEFFAFLRELIAVPHHTRESITIYRLPKTLIHAIARNLPTFDDLGPNSWVGQGLCSHDDIKWSCALLCDCGELHADYNMGADLPTDPLRMCDTVRLVLGVTVHKPGEAALLIPKETLLHVQITLAAGFSMVEAEIPKRRIVDIMKRRRVLYCRRQPSL
ncbi:unnamed protein product [Cylicocyclus nassatus]|uniref:F-box domain-containing protein n=1 Tax=Cylicocyclus nassatus TaxID=53992 RepID=A0AA36DMU2_CYLNA|nr:unnamed protein product [Cylicocyclus nassatus]